MSATTQNTVNIINSNISNALVQITQSGKDTISKETALKLQELVNSERSKDCLRTTDWMFWTKPMLIKELRHLSQIKAKCTED